VLRNDFEEAARLRGAAAASWASGEASMLRYGAMTDQRREADALLRSVLGDEHTTELIDLGGRIGADAVVAEVLAST